MHDRDDDDNAPVENPVQSLKAVAFLLKGLYTQLADERESITLASGQMAHAVKQFKAHLVRFEKFEQECQNNVEKTVQKQLLKSIQEAAETISDKVTEKSSELINQSIKDLKQTAQFIKTEFEVEEKNRNFLQRWLLPIIASTALASGLLGGLIVNYYFPVMNESTTKYITAGEVLFGAWTHLSNDEQKKIIKFGNEEVLNLTVKKE